MAGEITISLSVVGSKGGAVASATDSDVIDMGGSNMSAITQTVPITTSAALVIGSVAIGGIMVVKNLSAGSTVYINNNGAATVAGAPIKIKYGETALLRTSSTGGIYHAVADIAALVQVVCFDN